MLKQRILTALVLIPLFLGLVLFLPPQGFFIVTAILTGCAAFEWSALMGLVRYSQRAIYILLKRGPHE